MQLAADCLAAAPPGAAQSIVTDSVGVAGRVLASGTAGQTVAMATTGLAGVRQGAVAHRPAPVPVDPTTPQTVGPATRPHRV